MKTLVLFFFITLLSITSVAQNEVIEVNLDGIREQLQFTALMYDKHPYFPKANSSHLVNPISVLSNAHEYSKNLGEEASSFNIEPTALYGIHYSGAAGVSYNLTKIQSLKDRITMSLEKLYNLSFVAKEIQADLNQVISRQSKDKTLGKLVNDFLLVSPLLYDYEGKGLSETIDYDDLKDKLAKLSPSEMDNLYTDLLKNHLLHDLSKDKKSPEINSFENTVFNKEIKASFVLEATGGNREKTRNISIQEIPKPISLFRGCIGSDCSMRTVAFFAIPKTTKVFWIRKSLNRHSKPDGYVLVTMATFDGKSYPYIITVNGSTLSTSDTRTVHQMILDYYKTDHLILLDSSANSSAMNTAPVREGFKYSNAKKVSVEFPEGWHKIQELTKSFNSNYYSPSGLSEAYLLSRSELLKTNQIHIVESIESEAIQDYKKMGDLNKMSLYERASLASKVVDGNSVQSAETYKMLGVYEAQVNLAKDIYVRSQNLHPLHHINILEAEELLNFNLIDFESLHMHTRARSLKNYLYLLKSRNSFSPEREKEFAKMVNSTFNELYSEAMTIIETRSGEWTDPYRSAIRHTVASIAELPSEYVKSYYPRLLNIFTYLDEKGRGFYFHSIESHHPGKSIDAYLDFLIHPETIKIFGRESFFSTSLLISSISPSLENIDRLQTFYESYLVERSLAKDELKNMESLIERYLFLRPEGVFQRLSIVFEKISIRYYKDKDPRYSKLIRSLWLRAWPRFNENVDKERAINLFRNLSYASFIPETHELVNISNSVFSSKLSEETRSFFLENLIQQSILQDSCESAACNELIKHFGKDQKEIIRNLLEIAMKTDPNNKKTVFIRRCQDSLLRFDQF